MAIIVPTITTADQTEFDQNMQSLTEFTKRIQVDISDGTFASTVLVPLSNVRIPEGVKADIHLMTAKPSQYLQTILQLKPNLCILHVEVDDDVLGIIQQLRSAGIQVGLAVLKGTFPGRFKEFLAQADHIMIFAGNLGAQGGAMDFLQIEKIPLLKEIKPDAEIGWDGGANLSNVRALAHSGVDVINVGSAITKASDRAGMYQSLLVECEKKGVLV